MGFQCFLTELIIVGAVSCCEMKTFSYEIAKLFWSCSLNVTHLTWMTVFPSSSRAIPSSNVSRKISLELLLIIRSTTRSLAPCSSKWHWKKSSTSNWTAEVYNMDKKHCAPTLGHQTAQISHCLKSLILQKTTIFYYIKQQNVQRHKIT